MERYALPFIGSCAITKIEPMQVLEILKSVEAQGTYETRSLCQASCRPSYKKWVSDFHD
ncbi:MAG: hypothetical protein G3I11_01255 [Ferrovum sp.]|nr:hypothetical protein [Ferrovum sp.]